MGNKMKHKITISDRFKISRQKHIRHRRKYKKSLGFLSWRKIILLYQEEIISEFEKMEKKHLSKKYREEIEKQNDLLRLLGLIR